MFGECVTVDILYNLKNPQVEALLIDQLLGDIRRVCDGGHPVEPREPPGRGFID